VTRRRSWRIGGATIVTAALALSGAGALAAAATLAIAGRASVMNTSGATTRADVVVNPHGRAIYTLTGDSTRHPRCTSSSGCLAVWPPVTVRSTRSLHVARGIHGHLSVWRHNGLIQLTLNGHPLYTYSGDSRSRQATGEGIASFGGIWHVVTPSGKAVTFARQQAAPAPPASSCTTGLCY
jgi:predicted lipoprotein with Yx(FWY)xxD motif